METSQTTDWKEGMRCLAKKGSSWQPGTIHRVNEDGTFDIEFEHKEMTIMPYWYSMTHREISMNIGHQYLMSLKGRMVYLGIQNLNSFSEVLTIQIQWMLSKQLGSMFVLSSLKWKLI